MSSRTSRLTRRFFHDSPLRHKTYRIYYIAAIATAMGYTMQGTIAAWLMATLTPSELMVALVQTASMLPTLLFGLVAGSLADIMDRRKVLIVTQTLLIASTALLGLAEIFGAVSSVWLLIATFVIGVGFTFYMPAQQASLSDLVPKQEMQQALGLGSAGFNVSRAAGPALAGLLTAFAGSGFALLLSALCFVLMIFAVSNWKKVPAAIPGVPERLIPGIQSGLRYARHSPLMLALLGRNFLFCLCAAALWALLPVIARDKLSLSADGFGLLLACFGFGGILASLTVPKRVTQFGLNATVNAGTCLWVAMNLVLAWSSFTPLSMIAMFFSGIAWICVMSAIWAGVQSSAPAWVRARAVSMVLVVMQATLALASIFWGWLAALQGIGVSLAAAAVSMLALLLLTVKMKVHMGDEADVTPYGRIPELTISIEPFPDDGPVLIQVHYQIDPKDQPAFLRAVQACEATRRRNGASDWRVFRDLGEPGMFIERFIVTSWAEYVRLRARMSLADRKVHETIEQFQKPGVEIRITRLLSTHSRDLAEPEAP